MPVTKKSVTYTSTCDESRAIAAADPRFARLIEVVGPCSVNIGGDPFASLAESIVSQFLSYHAANAIWARLEKLLGWGDAVTPEPLAAAGDDELRATGLSRTKIASLRELAQKTISGEAELGSLDAMTDDEVVAVLTKLRGIGPWTAEMFLIFALGRQDVFSWRDAGLVRAAKWLHGIEKGSLAPKEETAALIGIAERWSPHRSVASFYLWEAIHKKFPNL